MKLESFLSQPGTNRTLWQEQFQIHLPLRPGIGFNFFKSVQSADRVRRSQSSSFDTVSHSAMARLAGSHRSVKFSTGWPFGSVLILITLSIAAAD